MATVLKLIFIFSRLLCLSRPNEDGPRKPMPLHRIYKGGSWLLTRPEEEYGQTGTLLEPMPGIEPDRTSYTDHLTGSRANIQVIQVSMNNQVFFY